jgi:hypothetical protein
MKPYRQTWWWLWSFTGLALVASLAGWAPGLPLAVVLSIVQVAHQALRTRGLWALSVQVRVLFLGVLLLGTLPGLWPLHALQVAGIAVRVLLDYCIAARLLSLMPWNRSGPLTLGGVRAAFVAPLPKPRIEGVPQS